MSGDFDRVRPRDPDQPAQAEPARSVDTAGRAALFSAPPPPPGLGSVAITCSACQTRTLVGYWTALRLAIPSVHVPIVRRPHTWWLRCPACEQRTWVAVTFRPR